MTKPSIVKLPRNVYPEAHFCIWNGTRLDDIGGYQVFWISISLIFWYWISLCFGILLRYLIEHYLASLSPPTRCQKIYPRCGKWKYFLTLLSTPWKTVSTLIQNHFHLLNNYNNMCDCRSTNHSPCPSHFDFRLSNRGPNIKWVGSCKGPESSAERRANVESSKIKISSSVTCTIAKENCSVFRNDIKEYRLTGDDQRHL